MVYHWLSRWKTCRLIVSNWRLVITRVYILFLCNLPNTYVSVKLVYSLRHGTRNHSASIGLNYVCLNICKVAEITVGPVHTTWQTHIHMYMQKVKKHRKKPLGTDGLLVLVGLQWIGLKRTWEKRPLCRPNTPFIYCSIIWMIKHASI